jgi:hypothetical protein
MEASKRPDRKGEEEVEEGGGGEDIMGKSMMVVVRVQRGMLKDKFDHLDQSSSKSLKMMVIGLAVRYVYHLVPFVLPSRHLSQTYLLERMVDYRSSLIVKTPEGTMQGI